jgi:hypothetical protein
MSGGEIVVAPAVLAIAPAIAAAAVVVVGAGLAAALLIKATQAGTEAAGRALEDFGREMEQTAKAQDDLAIRSRLWDLAAGSVAQTNQELCLLTARAERAGARLPMPGPFDLTGHNLADTRGWVASAQQSLVGLRAAVERAESDRERRELLSKLPVPPGESMSAADLLARCQEALANRRRPQPVRGVTQPVRLPDRAAADRVPADRAAAKNAWVERLHADVDAILCRLDIDANATERETAIVAAARVAQQKQAGMTRTYLDALARTVDKEINPRAARRRDAALLLVGLEHPAVAQTIAQTALPLPPHLQAIDRLRSVVAGDTDLTDADRRMAQDALAWAQQQMERRRLLDALAETFNGLGYSVSTGMQVNHTAALCVAREAWRDGHTADVWVDDAGQVRFRLVELAAGAPAAAARCDDLNDSMRAVGNTLAEHGFHNDVAIPETLLRPVIDHTRRPSTAAPGQIIEDAKLNARHMKREEVGE